MESEIGIAQPLNDTMQSASDLFQLMYGTNSCTWAKISHVSMSLGFKDHDSVHDDIVQNVTHHV